MISNLLKLFWKKIKSLDLFRNQCTIDNSGICLIRKNILGSNNSLSIGKGSVLWNVHLRVRGNSNRIVVGKNVKISKGCSIWVEGNNISVSIGDDCTFSHDTQLCAQEDKSSISIGNDCMFSHHINIRTSDSHIIYDLYSNQRINAAKSVTIGEHVWIAPMAIVLKGVNIGDGCIIGTNSIVTKDIPKYCLAVGMPAKVVKDNISWKRDALF